MTRALRIPPATWFVILAIAAGCQQPRGDMVDRLLIGEVMMHSELSANLRALAVPGGRLSGTAGADDAARFVADKLRAYGLQNVHLEPFEMQCWVVHNTQVTLLGDPPRVLEGAVGLGRTLSTPPGGVTAELIDLGEVSKEDFAARGSELGGKFVLVRDGGMSRRDKLRLACEHGAAGLVVMSQPDREPIIGSGHSAPRPEPAVVIRHDDELIERLKQDQPVRLRVDLQTENWSCRPNNAVGEIPGTGPLAREVVIISAHLDSWHLAEGAIDNGTGSATILETARALARVGWQPRRTVRFVWFMAEEIGLEGSESYVRAHMNELDNVVAVINVDMPGSPRKIGHFHHPEIEPFLRSVMADLSAYELSGEIGDWSGEWSDHAPFTRQGVCALSIGGELGPGVKNYHTAGDTYDAVDRRGTIQSSAVFAVLARRLADAPQRPSVRLEPTPAED